MTTTLDARLVQLSDATRDRLVSHDAMALDVVLSGAEDLSREVGEPLDASVNRMLDFVMDTSEMFDHLCAAAR